MPRFSAWAIAWEIERTLCDAKFGVTNVDVLQQERGELLVIGIRLGLARPHRHRPFALPGHDGLVVPVGALDEPHIEPAAARPRPGEQIPQVLLAVAKVGLERDPHPGLLGELGLLQYRLEKGQGEVLQLVALHVEVDQRPHLGGSPENRTQAPFQGLDGVLRVGGMHLRREGRDFHRQVEPREDPLRPHIAGGRLLLLRVEGRDVVEHLAIAVQEDVRLLVADHGLAQEVDRDREALLRILADLPDQVRGVLARDELARHVHDLRLDRSCDDPGGEGGGGQTRLEGGVQLDRLVAEVLLEVLDDVGRRVEGGQDVDKAKQLGLECRVLHRPLHDARIRALLGEYPRSRVRLHPREQVVADAPNPLFKRRIGGRKSWACAMGAFIPRTYCPKSAARTPFLYKTMLPEIFSSFGLAEELFDLVSDTIFFVKDAEGRYVAVNQSLVERCGRRHKREIIGKTVSELYPANLAAGYAFQDRMVLRTGRRILEKLELHLYPDRRRGWCLTSKIPLRNAGRIVGLAGISRDIGALDKGHAIPASLAAAIGYLQRAF